MALHMYYVGLNEYFMLRMQSGLRLCGTLLTSGLGAGYHLWPHDSVCAKWTPPPPSSTLKPINGLGCGNFNRWEGPGGCLVIFLPLGCLIKVPAVPRPRLSRFPLLS